MEVMKMTKDLKTLVQEYRNSIYAICNDGKKEIWISQWGAGERKVDYDIKQTYGESISIYIPYLSFHTLEKAMVFSGFCNKQGVMITKTYIGYLSYGRQERETDTEPKLISLMLRNIMFGLHNPIVIEPHNVKSVQNAITDSIYTTPYFHETLQSKVVVSPDRGAKTKLKSLGIEAQIEIEKTRSNGEVHSQITYDFIENLGLDANGVKATFVIYDDICDGGRTFANVADLIKERYPNSRVELYVAHAILPFGVESLQGKIDKIVAFDTCFPQGTYYDGFLEVRSAYGYLF